MEENSDLLEWMMQKCGVFRQEGFHAGIFQLWQRRCLNLYSPYFQRIRPSLPIGATALPQRDHFRDATKMIDELTPSTLRTYYTCFV